MSAEGDIFPVIALLDTEFTGWLAIDSPDADTLGWMRNNETQDMQIARGEARFSLYEGTDFSMGVLTLG
jgi:predicted aspartyl protease